MNELRIGNYIYGIEDGYKETAMEICSFHNDNTFRLKIGNDSVGCYSTKRIIPIPLTEEWLLKFEFQKDENNWFSKKYKIDSLPDHSTLSINLNTYNTCVWYADKGSGYCKPVKNIHCLQNLYFALTGQELTLNP